MADLFDRIYGGDPDNEFSDANTKLSTHALTASLTLYSENQFTSVQIINFWNMDAAAQVDWNALVANVDAETAILDKIRFSARLEAAGLAVEMGAITTKAQYRTAAGI